jgi:hypothetical protein
VRPKPLNPSFSLTPKRLYARNHGHLFNFFYLGLPCFIGLRALERNFGEEVFSMKARKLIALAVLLGAMIAGSTVISTAGPWPPECGVWTICD